MTIYQPGDVTPIATLSIPNDAAPIARAASIYGGYIAVTDTTERNAIPTSSRREGLMVRCNDGSFYILRGGITNSDWVLSSVVGVPGSIGPDGQVAYGASAGGAGVIKGSEGLKFAYETTGTNLAVMSQSVGDNVGDVATITCTSVDGRTCSMRSDLTSSFIVADAFALKEGGDITPFFADGIHGILVAQPASPGDAIGRLGYVDSAGNVKVLRPYADWVRTVSTATATAALIHAENIADNTINTIRARIVGRQLSSGNTMVFDATQYVVRTGSTPRLLGSAAVAINAKDDATWGTPTFTINGFNTEIKVVGKASTSINWQCEVWNDSGSTP